MTERGTERGDCRWPEDDDQAEREEHREAEPDDRRADWTGAARESGARGGDQAERDHAESAIDEDDGRGERSRARRPGSIRHPDDVAADVAREKVVEERGDQERLGESAGGRMNALRVQQHAPPPRADPDHGRVGGRRASDPEQVRAARERPQTPDVAAGEEQRDQTDAENRLEEESRQ